MQILRIRQHHQVGDRYQCEVSLADEQGAETRLQDFGFALSPEDQERIRWYLEDYPQYPYDPAPQMASEVQGLMEKVGTQLFLQLFGPNTQLNSLWGRLSNRLGETRIEIDVSDAAASSVPWELLRVPSTGVILSLAAHSFVRTSGCNKGHEVSRQLGPRLNVLLIISRPDMHEDVPFRGVANHLLHLSAETTALKIDFLRPSTFRRLEEVLRAAKRAGDPYDLVHFDGHGIYSNGSEFGLESIPRGYLLFENPQSRKNRQYVNGKQLGRLLSETDVPFLVLNACRSAHAEPGEIINAAEGSNHSKTTGTAIPAYGSLAQEALEASLVGIVAMRYTTYVDTAVMFMGRLYAALAAGLPLGAAVNSGRRYLADKPVRTVGIKAVHLQDWAVPTVFEQTRFTLAAPNGYSPEVAVTGGDDESYKIANHALPDDGLLSQDSILIALDRAFDRGKIVALHGHAGGGKSTIASEFATWYTRTGGLGESKQHSVILTSFQANNTVATLCANVAETYPERANLFASSMFQRSWPQLDSSQQLQIVLAILRSVDTLWVWDQFDDAATDPDAEPKSNQNEAHESRTQELHDLLRALSTTSAKILIVSRTDQTEWLGDIEHWRIRVGPISIVDSMKLLRSIAVQFSRELTDLTAWTPLLEFAHGNPLTLSVAATQLLNQGAHTRQHIDAYIAAVIGGSQLSEEGVGDSLDLLFRYGLLHEFTDEERGQLLYIGLFQNVVNAAVFPELGSPEAGEARVPELEQLTPESTDALFRRATKVGLLRYRGPWVYEIHPALPLFMPRVMSGAGLTQLRRRPEVVRGFVSVMNSIAHTNPSQDWHITFATLRAEEANLLNALDLVKQNRLWGSADHILFSLNWFYRTTGRLASWNQHLKELVADAIDPATEGPLPSADPIWPMLMSVRIDAADHARDFPEAERLQRILLDNQSRTFDELVSLAPDALSDVEERSAAMMSQNERALGNILRNQRKSECVERYERARRLAALVGNRRLQADAAFDLARAYDEITELLDWDMAERLYLESLRLYDTSERVMRSRVTHHLGGLARHHLENALRSREPVETLEYWLNRGATYLYQALNLLPSQAHMDRARLHQNLGELIGWAGHVEQALAHFQESISIHEEELAAEDAFFAAQARLSVAVLLVNTGRIEEARMWARTALETLERYEGDPLSRVDLARYILGPGTTLQRS